MTDYYNSGSEFKVSRSKYWSLRFPSFPWGRRMFCSNKHKYICLMTHLNSFSYCSLPFYFIICFDGGQGQRPINLQMSLKDSTTGWEREREGITKKQCCFPGTFLCVARTFNMRSTLLILNVQYCVVNVNFLKFILICFLSTFSLFSNLALPYPSRMVYKKMVPYLKGT